MAKLQKSIDKRNALIKATIELVNNNGFHATPMSKIAKMANVSPATIYLYFENKQDLVNKTYIDVKAKYTNYAFETYDDQMPVEKGFELIWKKKTKVSIPKKCFAARNSYTSPKKQKKIPAAIGLLKQRVFKQKKRLWA